MNLFYKNNGIKIAVAMLFAGQLLLSCSKDKAEVPKPPTKFDGKISVQVLGIEDAETVPLAKSQGKVASKSSERGRALPKVVSFPGFDAATSVERDVLKQSNVTLGDVPKGMSNSNELMAAAMAPDVKYRLFLYKKDGTFVSSTLLSSGTPGTVDVEKGVSYDWYAISYNANETVPDVDPLNPALALPGGKDVLYASGEIVIPANSPDGNSPLGITFKHSLARIAIELNTMGMFANMASATVAVSGLPVKTGTLNIKTGQITNLTNYVQTIDYSSFTNVNALYGDAKVAYAYTADVAPVSALTVTVSGLSITLDDNSTRSFDALLAATPSVFTFNLTPVLGSSYRALINLIESPLTLDGVRWARTNLYRVAGHNPYRFAHTYTHTNARNTYFSFKGIVPETYGINGDPCTQVYPAGIWRQASEADFRTITGVLGVGAETATYGTVGALGYFQFNAATGTAAPYPDDNLRFNFNGEGIGLSLVANIIQLDFGSTYGNAVHMWTSSAGLNIPGLAGLGAWHYHGNRNTPPLLPPSNTSALTPSLLSVSVIGIDVIQTNFKNVRCVRN